MRRLPPLGAIRAFEAGARHLNFTAAATELCVTQAAISHQVRLLEEWLGTRLFERKGHALCLTAKGAAYLPELTEALDRMSAATMRLREREDGPLRITALPSFASCWLVPRLGRFRALHPEIDLRLTSSAELWDFSKDSFDLGIRSGLGRWPGLKADLIARETLSPVCAPVVAAGPPTLLVPSDLLNLKLLQDTPRDAWSRWFEHAGINGARIRSPLLFNDAGLVLQAALDGQGVALGRLVLARQALSSGNLVQPFAIELPNDYSYWLVYTRAALERPDIAAFRAWLRSEVSA
ncbi:transcriptional regulator GcvA [Novosphingobium terrae]|uniref:transcriptional regulator GcvA n=1 Tax=Novosphingobium terrae TaxID=2726189 RepID=UPI00197D421E|nr:transcriptional regulator GcvA [Novosphingobium terrae]